MMRQLNLRFAMVMLGFVGVVWLTYREEVLGSLLAPLAMLTAQITIALLNWLGMEAVRLVTVISHPDGFAYEIYYRCTGILPVAFLTVSVLAYPGPLCLKFFVLVVGVPILISLNLMRLIHLFYIGVHNPAAFEIAHEIVWQALIILVIVVLWLAWTRWSDKRAKKFYII